MLAAKGPFKTGAPADPAEQPHPWPLPLVAGLAVAGLISPLICFAAAALVYTIADRDQGATLTGAGLAHLLLGLTLFGGG